MCNVESQEMVAVKIKLRFFAFRAMTLFRNYLVLQGFDVVPNKHDSTDEEVRSEFTKFHMHAASFVKPKKGPEQTTTHFLLICDMF